MKWYNSRLFCYVLSGILIFIAYRFDGFEVAMLLCMALIIGEQTFLSIKYKI